MQSTRSTIGSITRVRSGSMVPGLLLDRYLAREVALVLLVAAPALGLLGASAAQLGTRTPVSSRSSRNLSGRHSTYWFPVPRVSGRTQPKRRWNRALSMISISAAEISYAFVSIYPRTSKLWFRSRTQLHTSCAINSCVLHNSRAMIIHLQRTGSV